MEMGKFLFTVALHLALIPNLHRQTFSLSLSHTHTHSLSLSHTHMLSLSHYKAKIIRYPEQQQHVILILNSFQSHAQGSVY